MAKVRVKPLKGPEFYLEDIGLDSTTVSDIKQRIVKTQGEAYEADEIKLILQGKVLPDNKTLAEYNFKEGENFLVCMVAKKKKEKPKETAVKPVSTPSAPLITPAPNVSASSPVVTQSAAPAPIRTPAAPVQVPVGPVISNEVVQLITSMGFAETDARAALQAAFGNPERAVEFLMNPELMQAAVARQERNQGGVANPRQNPTAGVAAGGGGAASGNLLEQFRNSPMFGQVRQQLMQNPGSIQQVLEVMQQVNPQLYNQITASEESLTGFVESLLGDDADMIDENANPFGDADEGGMGSSGAGAGGIPGLDNILSPQIMQQALQQIQQLPAEQRNALLQRYGINAEMLEQVIQAAGGGGGEGGAPPVPRAAQIQLTPGEIQAIDRLRELGFSRRACLEAYLACDKNEEMAANLLFTNPPEEDGDMELDQPPPPPPANSNSSSGGSGGGSGGRSGGGNSMDEDTQDDDDV